VPKNVELFKLLMHKKGIGVQRIENSAANEDEVYCKRTKCTNAPVKKFNAVE